MHRRADRRAHRRAAGGRLLNARARCSPTPPAGWPRPASSRPGWTPSCCSPTCSACPAARLLTLDDGAGRRRRPVRRRCVDQRADRVPLQHLTGRAPFRHLELAVGPGVFVPRPETELLAGWVLDRLAGLDRAGRRRPGRGVRRASRCRSRTSTPAPGSPPSSATRARSSGPGTTPPPAPAAGDTPVEVLAGDMTDPGAAARARRHRRRRRLQPAVRARRRAACRARWPTTTRRSRCGAARTAWTSSAGCWSPPPGCCARAAGSGIEHADQQGERAAGAGPRRTAAGPTSRTTPTWPAARASPPPAAAADRPCGKTAAPWPTSTTAPTPTPRAAGLDAAAAAIGRGELVLLPTDTVYGVAADAFTPAAVTGLLAAKNRGRTHAGAGADRRGVDAGRAGRQPAAGRHTSSPRRSGPAGSPWCSSTRRRWPGTSATPRARSPSGCPTTTSPATCCGAPARWPSPAPTAPAARPRRPPQEAVDQLGDARRRRPGRRPAQRLGAPARSSTAPARPRVLRVGASRRPAARRRPRVDGLAARSRRERHVPDGATRALQSAVTAAPTRRSAADEHPHGASPTSPLTMREYAVVLLTAALVTFLTTPVVRMVAIRLRMMAAPRERDVHVIPTPARRRRGHVPRGRRRGAGGHPAAGAAADLRRLRRPTPSWSPAG